MKDLPAGWGWPANSRKAHYFPADSSFSICGRYGFYFSRRDPNDAVSPDDCAACRKKVGAPPERCPVAYCRGGHAPGGLHDIPPCLRACGPIRPGQGREHDPACPNAAWRREP